MTDCRLTMGQGHVIRRSVKYDPVLHIVLHQPEIPHNTGSVGRTCVAAGAKLWLVRPLGFRVDDYYLAGPASITGSTWNGRSSTTGPP